METNEPQNLSAPAAAPESPAPMVASVAAAEPVTQAPTRIIESHKVNLANERLQIEVLDLPGKGGASSLYQISGFDSGSNVSDPWKERYGKPSDHFTILFQQGPIAEVGVNGVTHEALLAIIEDRLKSFQAGPFACEENRLALLHLQACIRFLHMRTMRRDEAGTEGTHQGV